MIRGSTQQNRPPVFFLKLRGWIFLVHGVINQCDDMFYIRFKKHFCPDCKIKVKVVKVSQIVNSESPEAKNFDFSMSLSGTYLKGNIKFVWKEFVCPQCGRKFTVKEMQRIEAIEERRLK